MWVNCRRQDCDMVADPVDRSQGEPEGWLRVSVNLPPALDRSGHGRPYRMLAEYCSLDCLVADWGRVAAGNARAQAELAALQSAG